MSAETRYYFLVRKDLGMGRGKIAAQVGHAAIRLAQQLPHNILQEYHEDNAAQIVLYIKDLTEMEQLEQQLKTKYNTTKIIDAGATQVTPNSATVLGIGPCMQNLTELGGLKLVN